MNLPENTFFIFKGPRLKLYQFAIFKWGDPCEKQLFQFRDSKYIYHFLFFIFFQLTHMTMAGELKHGKRVEELKFTENVKKKTSNFVRKYMAKHDASKAEYQRSPPPAPKD